MIISKRFDTFFLLFLCFFSFDSFSKVAKHTVQQNTPLPSMQEMLNETYSVPLEIIHLTQHLSMLINNHQIKKIKNRRYVLDTFRDIQMILTSTLNEQVIVDNLDDEEVKLQIIYALSSLSDYCLSFLEICIKTQFKETPEFDFASIIKRGPTPTTNKEHCAAVVNQLSIKTKKIKRLADDAGLLWYNIQARRFEKYVLDPCFKYNISKLTMYLSAGALFITMLLWLESYDALKKEILQNANNMTYEETFDHLYSKGGMFKLYADLQSILGVQTPKTAGGYTNHMELMDPVYSLVLKKANKHSQSIPIREIATTLESFASSLGIGKLPHLAPMGILVAAECKQVWAKEIKGWFKKHIETYWNLLRGGAYTQKAVNGIWDFQPKITFDDVIGLEEIKEEFSLIIKFIENPEQYIRVNAAPPRGYLLTGPTRTGKTFIVEALCGEIQRSLERLNRKNEMKFWRVNSKIISEFGLRDVLSFAKENAPIVLFIDEIDLHGLQRVTNNRMLEEFLTSLGNTLDNDPRKQVILITATNKPETLDKALRQPDRLGKEIRFEYPSLYYRKKYLNRQLELMAIDSNQFNLDLIAQKTAGKSFADLSGMINNAIMRSWMYNIQLTQDLFERSIDSEIRRLIIEDRKNLPQEELSIMATNLAGKILISLLCPTGMVLDKATLKAVMPDLQEELPFEELMQKNDKERQQKIRHGDVFRYYPSDSIHISSYAQKINEIKFLIAGSLSEEVVLGSTSYEYRHEDLNTAFAGAREICFEGIDPKTMSKKQFNDLSQKAYELIDQCKQEVRDLFYREREALEKITEYLLTHKTINAFTAKQIVEATANK